MEIMDNMTLPELIHYWVVHFVPLFKQGIEWTVPLTIISFVLGIILAMITALVRLSGFAPLVAIARFYVWIIRGTPLLVQLFIIFYGLPSIGITLPPYPSAVIGFTLSVGAYNSEVIRGAILSISKGQWEAAHSLGMTRGQALRRVILPQAARVALVPLANAFISLVKDTSLAAIITVREMFEVGEEINANTYSPLATYIEVAFIYLMFSTVLFYAQGWMEKRLARHVAR